MVSRRNFFTIMILLAVMIFMFMFVSVIKQEFNIFDRNSNGADDLDKEGLQEEYEAVREELQAAGSVAETVYYLTEETESPVDLVVESWGNYAKRTIKKCTSLADISVRPDQVPEWLIVNGEELTLKRDADLLMRFAEKGSNVIFATLPKPKVIDQNETLRELMGITTVYSDGVWVDSMHLFPGLLIGSESIYEGDSGNLHRNDEEFHVPWYMVGEGTKTYMMGVVEDSDLKDQFMPAVLWRHAVGEGNVFCVNGDFAKHNSGVGLLTAFLAEAESYCLYPVVNAQNLVLANYAGFSEENSETLSGLYNQSQTGFLRDTVWPTIAAVNEATSAKVSLMAALQMEYQEGKAPEKDMLVYYLRLLKENEEEAGLTAERLSDISLEEKLERDRLYWDSEAGGYEIRSAFLEELREADVLKAGLPDLRTIVTTSEDAMPIGYLDEDLTVQRATSQGVEYEFLDDFANKSFETALGYTCIVLDMTDVVYPTEDQGWEVFAKKVTSNLSTYWKPYKGFDQTTISESDARIRKFLALDYRSGREGDTITLHVDGLSDKAYFVLKLHDEYPAGSVTVPYQDLGDGFYLFEISGPDTQIEVERDKRFIY